MYSCNLNVNPHTIRYDVFRDFDPRYQMASRAFVTAPFLFFFLQFIQFKLFQFTSCNLLNIVPLLPDHPQISIGHTSITVHLHHTFHSLNPTCRHPSHSVPIIHQITVHTFSTSLLTSILYTRSQTSCTSKDPAVDNLPI